MLNRLHVTNSWVFLGVWALANLRLADASAQVPSSRNIDRPGASQLKTYDERDAGKSGVSHYNLGELYYAQGRFEEALREFQQAIDLEEGTRIDQVYNKIGSIYYSQLRFDDAIIAFNKALKVSPRLLQAHLHLGEIYLRRNLHDGALAEYQAALALEPFDAEAQGQVAKIYLRTGQYRQAVHAARKALELAAQNRDARYTLANALMRLGKIRQGQKEMQKFRHVLAEAQAQEHRQRELETTNQEALFYLQRGEDEKAIALFRKAARCDPGNGATYFNLAMALIKTGKHEESIQNLRKALSLDLDFPEAHRYLAEEYELLGKLEESKREKAVYVRISEQRRKRKEGTADTLRR